MKFVIIIILSLIAIIELVVFMMTLEEEAIYREGIEDANRKRQENNLNQGRHGSN